MHFEGLEVDREQSKAPHLTVSPQIGDHRRCDLSICTFHLGFSLVGSSRLNPTPLHRAVDNGNVEIVRILVNAGADLNIKSSRGSDPTPLHIAVQDGNAELVRILVDAGADPNIRNHSNYGRQTPVDIAIGKGYLEIVRIITGTSQQLPPSFRSGDGA